MTRMYGNSYPSFAQLALMLRGVGGINPGYGSGWGGSPNGGYQTPLGRPSTSMNDWAATQNFQGPSGGGRLPISPAQEVLPGTSIPWIDTFPGDLTKPEYFPTPPNQLYPPVPGELPVQRPFDTPNRLGPFEDEDQDWPFPDNEECKEDIAAAIRFCKGHLKRMRGGRAEGNFGNSLIQCMRGQLSEECGGNPTGRIRA